MTLDRFDEMGFPVQEDGVVVALDEIYGLCVNKFALDPVEMKTSIEVVDLLLRS